VDIGRAFKTDFTMNHSKALKPISLGISYGNRYIPSKNLEWGFFTNTTFSNDYSFKKSDIKEYSIISAGLEPVIDINSEKSEYSTGLGATLSAGMKLYNKHKLRLHYIYTHRSQDYVNIGKGFAFQFDDGVFIKQYYVEKSIGNLTLGGSHQFKFLLDHKLEWSLTSGVSSLNQPDFKGFNYRVKKQEMNGLQQEYYQMDTYNWSSGTRDFTRGFDKNSNLDITYQTSLKDRLGDSYKIKLGARLQNKSRDFTKRSFYHKYGTQYGGSVIPPDITIVHDKEDFGKTLNANNYFDIDEDGNVIPGLIVVEGTSPSDAYESDEKLDASYFMVDFPLSFGIFKPLSSVRFISGIRKEVYNLELFPYHPISGKPFVSAITGDTVFSDIDEADYLPSLNLLIQLPNEFNIRLSRSQTVARAEFREMAPFEFQPFYGGDIVVGYPWLKTTDIKNYDLRVEWFRKAGELLAFSLFKKDFKNPIEVALIEASGKKYKTFQNANSADCCGLEFDPRIHMDFIPKNIGTILFLMNFTLTSSEVKVDSMVTIFTGYSVENEATSKRRPLQGQSDFIMNIGLNFNSLKGFNAALSYNTFSKRLISLGVADIPDEYEMPFHSLNFTVSKKYKNIKLSAKLKNTLNSKVELGKKDPTTKQFKQTEVYRPGWSFSLGVSYDL